MSEITRKFHLYRTSLVVVPLLVIGVLALIGWLVYDANAGLKGSGEITSESLTGMSAVGARITGDFDATIVFAGVGEPPLVRVTIDQNLHEFVMVEQEANMVDVRFAKPLRPSDRPKVWVSLPQVSALGADRGANVNVVLGGADALEVDVNGGATVNMSGSVAEMVLRAGGNSRVDLSPTQLLVADVVIASTSEVLFGFVGRVDGTVSQASTVVVSEGTLTEGMTFDETSDIVLRR